MTDNEKLDSFLKASEVSWVGIPVGIISVNADLQAEDRPLDCNYAGYNTKLKFKAKGRNSSGGWRAIFNRTRSTYSLSVDSDDSDIKHRVPFIYGQTPIGLRVPPTHLMRGYRKSWFTGLPIGSMVLSTHGKLWRLLHKGDYDRMIFHSEGETEARERVHPGLGLTDFFNHRRYVVSPFVIKHFATTARTPQLSVMLPNAQDVRDAAELLKLHTAGADLSMWHSAGYVPPEPEKVYSSEWAMLDDLCA